MISMFIDESLRGKFVSSPQSVTALQSTLKLVASDTITTDLAVICYLQPGSSEYQGLYRNELSRAGVKGVSPNPHGFTGPGGSDRTEFKIITLHFDPDMKVPIHLPLHGKRTIEFARTDDAFAFLFARELHAYRQLNHNLHPSEGQISAERWSSMRANECGFDCSINNPPRKSKVVRKEVTTHKIPLLMFG